MTPAQTFPKIKTLGKIIGTIILIFIIAFLSYALYLRWQQNQALAKAEAIQAALEARYQADTMGGKTPKETLELFIAALEKEDFDLASRYFVLTKQEEWKEVLPTWKQENLKIFIATLKTSTDKGFLYENNFQMVAKINGKPNLIITFVKYPQGIWKIKEI